MRLKLAIFDVDGTLVDSQGEILASMRCAFEQRGYDAPSRDAILGIVGLSLPQALAKLVPDLPEAEQLALVEGYKTAYVQIRDQKGVSPFYPGIADLLDRLAKIDHLLLAVATGKSRRGLDALINGHGLEGRFVSTQVSDTHPSKPHPSMLLECLAETGVDAQDAVMIGDTSYDMDMARNAGIRGIGVTWGYHAASHLNADQLVDTIEGLETAIISFLGDTA
ncbi:MAG: HAD-IA family hydrolase [Pelagimonas sp.]|jgi:phosphoglycolate phosphatase|nr:HAD-IA family hydrolase [Pelagimonas sp.]